MPKLPKLPKIDLQKLGRRVIAMIPSPQMIVIMGSTIGTVIALFVAQEWYRSYVALQVIEVERETPLGPEYPIVRAEHQRRLESGAATIADAKIAVGSRDRNSLEAIVPAASTDPAPAAGWAHQRSRADQDGDGHTDRVYVAPPIPGDSVGGSNSGARQP